MIRNQQSNDLASLCIDSAAEIKEIGKRLVQAEEKFLKSLNGVTPTATEFSAMVDIHHSLDLIKILTDTLENAASDLHKD